MKQSVSGLKSLKPVPNCPLCRKPMKVSGTLRPGQGKPKRLFTCMDVGCGNHKTYLRDGEEFKA